jgi:short-subunit dehydrogenase
MALVPNPGAVVTGAGGGLGRALCREIIRRGGRVVALSETLYGELVGSGVGVSVLCPTFFQTGIVDASRTSGSTDMREVARALMSGARIQADQVARIALDGVARNALHVLPHPDGRWLWRLKRLFPRGFHALTPRVLALRTRFATAQPR